jgi:hypothetical protein
MLEVMSYIGTLEQLFDIVPYRVCIMMISQQRDDNYVFRVTLDNGFVLVW